MASVADTWTPSCLQLRFALGGANFRRLSPAVLVRTRLRKLDRRIRVFCVAQNENGAQRSRNSGSWAGPDNGADSLSGWSGSGNGQDSEPGPEELQKKKSFGVAVGAGVVFAAGLTFAALAVGKRSTLRPKQEMEPLTTQQELFLVPEDQNVHVQKHEEEDKHIKLENIDPENETGIDTDSPSLSEKNRSGDDSVLFQIPNDGHVYTGTDASQSPQQEKLQDEANIVADVLVAPSTRLSSELLPDSEKVDALAASGNTASYNSLDSGVVDSNHTPKDKLGNDYTADESLKNDVADHKEDGPLKDANLNSSYQSGNIDHFESDYEEKTIETQLLSESDTSNMATPEEIYEQGRTPEVFVQGTSSTMEVHNSGETHSFGTVSMSAPANTLAKEQIKNGQHETNESKSVSESPSSLNIFSSAGIPAPSVISEALRVTPGKVLVPPAVDQVQGQALAALQAMKVIENDVQAGDLCTRREYARWLVSASSALSRNTISKVYPAMYIENVTELAFDDITPEDPDFVFIQGLAEAGLISSKLSRRDILSSAADEDESPYYFFPESPLSRQDLVSWKMALEKKELPEADRKVLHQLSGFIDVEKIHPDACPALVADMSSGEQGIIALAFGYTKLFQPEKPVTKAQAAVALATGEAADVVSEELARIEAESMAENAVAAHTALVAQVENDINANFAKVLSIEREKIDAVEKMAEEARHELENLRAKREEDEIALMKERAAVESEMEVLSRLRREVEEQLETLMSNKVEISYEKEKVEKLRMDAEKESQEIARLQYELEVERKALSMARAWAEDEAKRAREHAKALEEARDRWERQGIKVVVETDLQEEASGGDTWVNAAKEYSLQGTVSRAETLVEKLKGMAATVVGKSREVIDKIVNIIYVLISKLKERSRNALTRAEELKDVAAVKTSTSVEELKHRVGDINQNLREGAKRLVGDCRGGVEKLTQKFKT
ncbi:hypothetical protein CDL15_Pgr022954 [Punica granatum]|uniref:SLH domain-containing protein n=1 Tax=Punica granatum TaxID=22663 RepID=A0A218X5A4_PUNGR|nr:hypothetical protein CDL15_Pgr022954 [Punica granatum]